MASPNIVFRALAPLDAALASRSRDSAPAALAETARRDLTRYHAILEAELATAAAQLKPGEALALCDLLNATHIDEQMLLVRHLHHEVDDADAGLADKWDIDLRDLRDLVAGWPPARRLAVADAVERWWRSGGQEPEPSLRAVGLLPAEGALPADR